jgi:hypothetical protein
VKALRGGRRPRRRQDLVNRLWLVAAGLTGLICAAVLVFRLVSGGEHAEGAVMPGRTDQKSRSPEGVRAFVKGRTDWALIVRA